MSNKKSLKQKKNVNIFFCIQNYERDSHFAHTTTDSVSHFAILVSLGFCYAKMQTLCRLLSRPMQWSEAKSGIKLWEPLVYVCKWFPSVTFAVFVEGNIYIFTYLMPFAQSYIPQQYQKSVWLNVILSVICIFILRFSPFAFLGSQCHTK